MDTDTLPEIRILPDGWRYGRYCAALTAELPVGLSAADEALGAIGYSVNDADQWGRSYCDPAGGQFVELDEQESPYYPVLLSIRTEDLSADDIDRAKEQLRQVHGRIREELDAEYGEPLVHPGCYLAGTTGPGAEPDETPAAPRYQACANCPYAAFHE